MTFSTAAKLSKEQLARFDKFFMNNGLDASKIIVSQKNGYSLRIPTEKLVDFLNAFTKESLRKNFLR